MLLLINNQGKKTQLPLKGDEELILGRSPRCDIQVVADGISRQHLKLIFKGDTYYIIDLETTNGTFVNDKKIPPNEEMTFTTFFPIRVGHHVTISLVDHAPDREDDELTKITSRNRTKLTSSSIDALAKESANRKKENAKSNIVSAIVSVALLLGSYWYYKTEIDPEPLNEAVTDVVEVPKPLAPVNTIATEAVVDFEKFIMMDKCFATGELSLCESMQRWRNKEYLEGYVFYQGKFYYVVEQELSLNALTTSYELTEEDKEYLISLGKRKLKRKFNKEEFEANNYEVTATSIEQRDFYGTLLELKLNGALTEVMNNTLTDLVVIQYESIGKDFDVIYSKTFSEEQLKEISNKLSIKELYMARFQGLTIPVRSKLRHNTP